MTKMLRSVLCLFALGMAPAALAPDYAKSLQLSLLFYKAQRAGKLPDKEVPWRASAFTADRTFDGKDMTGGFFDAGDYVRFMLPQATSLTTLAHGMVDFAAGYKDAGQRQRSLEVLSWGADFLAKCVISPDRIVVQIGDGMQDHSVWVRPDEVARPYRVYEMTPTKPAADVAGAITAALASASIVVRGAGDKVRADRYLGSAKKALEFALCHPGLSSDSFPEIAPFYKSTSYLDDVALGAAWLHRATGNATYLLIAKDYFDRSVRQGVGWTSHDWDQQQYMVAALLARAGVRGRAQELLRGFEDAWYNARGSVKKTPKGLRWLSEWGPLRYNANAVFLMLANAQMSGDPRALRAAVCFARGQIGYMLGFPRGRSFQIGYGNNGPKQPHHRASSCPLPPKACGWDWFNRKDANPQVLLGALVGGPGLDDAYVDARQDFKANEVAIDYNAGFTGALAALVEHADVKC